MLMLKLAFRNILRNRRRTILTILSMFGGYVLMSVQLSVTEGSYDQMLEFYTKDTTGHVQITAPGYVERPTLYKSVPVSDDIMTVLGDQPGVQAVTARIESSALAYGETKSFPVEVKGVDPGREADLSYLVDKVSKGDYLTGEPDSEGYYDAMIGAQAARQLNLGIGDELVLISQGADGSLANDLYRISAILGESEDAEARWVVLPLQAAQAFYVMPGEAHRLIVLGRNHHQARTLETELQNWVDHQWPEDDYRATAWQEVAKDFYRTMQADKEGGQVTLYILVFLVCIGVLNTVLMSVMERTGEFGVLKAIGTSPSRLFWLIVLETLLLAFTACVIGVLAAWPINAWFTAVGIQMAEPMEISGIVFSHYKGQLSLYVFAYPAVVILLAAVIIALMPGLRAARIVPVDAMRTL